MDMETLGYFLYMEEQEKEKYKEVNVELEDHLVADQTTQEQNRE